MSNDKLVFTYTTQDSRISGIEDPYCDEIRDTEMMDKLVKEYELNEISEDFKAQKERREMDESVNYSIKDNDGYEPA